MSLSAAADCSWCVVRSNGNIHANHRHHLPDAYHPDHYRSDQQTAMRGKPITCRLMIPDGNVYREWDELTGEEKESFGKQCAERMGKTLNEIKEEANGKSE